MPASKKTELLGNHQRCWLWGRHLIDTTLSAGHWPILELLISQRLPDDRLSALREAARQRQIPFQIVSPDRITQTCRHPDHQGVAAKMPDFPYHRLARTVGEPPAGKGPVLCLDGIQDAYNVGAILRSGDVFGVQGVCLASREQVGVTSMVARASAGAVNHLPICRVPDLCNLAESLHARGVQIIGASEKGTVAPDAVDWTQPSALIMGNESRGIRPELIRHCDALTRIPQRPGAVDSLNVAAAAVLLYEAARQRRR